MKKIIIYGGKKLHGSISISGSKNSSLAILASSMLFEKKVVLKNIPIVEDIKTMIKLLIYLGKIIKVKKKTIEITNSKKFGKSFIAPYELVKTMRAGILVLGPLISKFKKAKVSLPGGCAIGARPIDLHLKFLKSIGVRNHIDKGYVISKLNNIKKKNIYRFQKISVGATINSILASCLIPNKIILNNIAIEPEIIDLIKFLKKAGIKIKFLSNRKIEILGKKHLNQISYEIMPDRIEAGTYMIASAITNSKLTIKKININHVQNTINYLSKANIKVKKIDKNSVQILPGKIKSVSFKTSPYPGFASDMQAQFMSLMNFANGTSKIKEEIFENRFLHVSELNRMGADISIMKNVATIKGIDNLRAAEVMATDLRASVSLVLAGLATKGKTVINRIYHLERGYEDLVYKLKNCGAKIKKINV